MKTNKLLKGLLGAAIVAAMFSGLTVQAQSGSTATQGAKEPAAPSTTAGKPGASGTSGGTSPTGAGTSGATTPPDKRY